MASNLCFYLSNWQIKDQESLKAIADFGAHVYLGALAVQRCVDAPLIMDLFSPQQLSIVSVDVDEDKGDLEAIVQGYLPEGVTHILLVERYDPNFIFALLKSLKDIEIGFQEIIYFLEADPTSKNPNWWQRFTALDGIDFRPFQKALAAYPSAFLKDLSRSDLKSSRRLLVRTVQSDFKVKSFTLITQNTESLSNPLGWWQRLYWNSYLLFLSVLRGTTHPLHSSLAMAFGVFVAFTPLYGLQTLLIALGCALLRLNFAVAFLGAQISIPPIYTLVVAAELIVGAWLLDRELSLKSDWLSLAQEHMLSWVVGTFIVGGAIALICASLWYNLLIRKQKKVSAL